jgi:hypothetical protein
VADAGHGIELIEMRNRQCLCGIARIAFFDSRRMTFPSRRRRSHSPAREAVELLDDRGTAPFVGKPGTAEQPEVKLLN